MVSPPGPFSAVACIVAVSLGALPGWKLLGGSNDARPSGEQQEAVTLQKEEVPVAAVEVEMVAPVAVADHEQPQQKEQREAPARIAELSPVEEETIAAEAGATIEEVATPPAQRQEEQRPAAESDTFATLSADFKLLQADVVASVDKLSQFSSTKVYDSLPRFLQRTVAFGLREGVAAARPMLGDRKELEQAADNLERFAASLASFEHTAETIQYTWFGLALALAISLWLVLRSFMCCIRCICCGRRRQLEDRPALPQAAQKPKLQPLAAKGAPECSASMIGSTPSPSRGRRSPGSPLLGEDEAEAAAAAADEELRQAQALAAEGEKEEQQPISPTEGGMPKASPVRREKRELAALMRQRRDACEVLENAPKEARASAVSEQKKDFSFLTKEELERQGHEAEAEAEAAKKTMTKDELKEWMENRRTMCSEIESPNP